MSPWEALERAADLNFELCDLAHPIPWFTCFPTDVMLPPPADGRCSLRGVTFDTNVDVRVINEKDDHHSLSLTLDQVQRWTDKPWSLRPLTSQLSGNEIFLNECECRSDVHRQVEVSDDASSDSFLENWPDDPVPPTVEEPLLSSALSPIVGLPVASEQTQMASDHDTLQSLQLTHVAFNVEDALESTTETSSTIQQNSASSGSIESQSGRDGTTADFSSSWLISLRSIWREHAIQEATDDNKVIYIESWYLHHDRHPRCDCSRTVRLDHMDHLWIDDLRQAWQDRLQDTEALHLEIVRPQPPRADSQRCVAHILLTQGTRPHHVGAVLTARFLEDHQTHLIPCRIG